MKPRVHTRRALLSARTPQTDLGLRGEGPGGHCFPRGSEDGLAQAAGCPRELTGGLSAQGRHLPLGAGFSWPASICGFSAHSRALSSGPVKAGLFPAKERPTGASLSPVKQRLQAREEGKEHSSECGQAPGCLQVDQTSRGRCSHFIGGCWGERHWCWGLQVPHS